MTVEQAQVVQGYAAIVQTVLAVLSLIVSALLAYLVYRATKTVSELQFTRSIFDAWMQLDTFLLSHPELIPQYERILNPSPTEGPAPDARKRLLTFIVLNPVHSIFHGVRKGHIEEESLTQLRPVLANLLEDEEVYRQTQTESFGTDFAKSCTSVRNASRAAAADVPKASR